MPVLFFVVGLFCGAAQGFFWDSGNEPAVWEAPGGFRFADTHFPAPLAAQSSPAEGAAGVSRTKPGDRGKPGG